MNIGRPPAKPTMISNGKNSNFLNIKFENFELENVTTFPKRHICHSEKNLFIFNKIVRLSTFGCLKKGVKCLGFNQPNFLVNFVLVTLQNFFLLEQLLWLNPPIKLFIFG